MLGIATHDSATGEKPTLASAWAMPFARCQSKTIREQYDCGCRFFDLRPKLINKQWRSAHGLYIAQRCFEDIVKEIDSFEDSCNVIMLYEGGDEHKSEYISYIDYLRKTYKHIHWGDCYIKATGERVVPRMDDFTKLPLDSQYKCLDGSSWHTYVPIPWLWKKIFHNKPKFTEDKFTMVDFL